MPRRLLLVQPSLQPPGGGNGVAAWMLQALVRDYDVTVLSWWPVDVAPINRFYGTSLHAADFASRTVPRWWRQSVAAMPVPAALVRGGLLMRYTRRIAGDFDIVLGAHNEMDYGRRGIQYIHYPTYFRPRPPEDFRWYHHIGPLLRAYYFVADGLAGYSSARMQANVTLANSDWTAARVRRFLGLDARTLYPPVVASAPPRRWDERESAFVAVGRLSPEKEYHRVIRIVAAVRRRHPAVRLIIVGTYDRATRRYYESLETLARALDPSGTLVEFRFNVSRETLGELLAATRYGIHGMRNEHFGMAPAEMVRAGMIVWVPDGGGQTEIVGEAAELKYDTEEDAADAIARVLADPSAQDRLRAHLRIRADRFSEGRFMDEVRAIVRDFVGTGRAH